MLFTTVSVHGVTELLQMELTMLTVGIAKTGWSSTHILREIGLSVAIFASLISDGVQTRLTPVAPSISVQLIGKGELVLFFTNHW